MKEKKWTFNDIPDLKGKTIIVTGSNVGLGYEAVKAFSRKGAQVISACRSVGKGEAAKYKIEKEHPGVKIEVMRLDLADLSSIHKFAENFKKKYNKLDVLLNNAGIMWCPYNKTKDGFESQIGVNHFGHYALTGLLLDVLKKTKGARVVNVSSLGHRRGKMDYNNLMFEKGGYTPTQAYFNSKLANLLFTYELQRKFKENKLDIISVAAHPGGSATDLSRHVEKRFFFKVLKPLFLVLTQSAEMGTLPEVRASVDPNVKGGEYYGPRGFNEMKGYPVLVKSIPASHSIGSAKRLWEISEKLTKIKYNFK